MIEQLQKISEILRMKFNLQNVDMFDKMYMTFRIRSGAKACGFQRCKSV